MTYPPHVHGGYNESLSFLQDAIRAVELAGGRPLVIASNHAARDDLLRRGYSARFLQPKPRDRVRELIRHIGIDHLRSRYGGTRWTVEDELRKLGARFAMFLSPSWWGGALSTLPFSTVVWDVSHLDEPSLPEVREGGEFTRRERFLSGALKRSEYVVVPDQHVQRSLISGSYVDQKRIIVRPFRPPAIADPDANVSRRVDALITEGKPYIYYPAYVWPHKGHRPLLKAMRSFATSNLTLVVTGGDRAEQLRELAQNLGVSDRVVVLGRVADEDSVALCKGASALVMPSLFGPSNLPPLEAWLVGTPVVYNEDFRSFAHDAAEYANPNDPPGIALAISRVLDVTRGQQLRENGRALLIQRRSESDLAVQEISQRLMRILARTADE